MSNTPNFKRGPSLAEFANRRRSEGSIEIPMSEGDPIVVPPREFWPRDVLEMATKQRSRRTGDRKTDDEIARALLGDEDFERFSAEVAGSEAAEFAGTAGTFFFLYFNEAVNRQQGVNPGE